MNSNPNGQAFLINCKGETRSLEGRTPGEFVLPENECKVSIPHPGPNTRTYLVEVKSGQTSEVYADLTRVYYKNPPKSSGFDWNRTISIAVVQLIPSQSLTKPDKYREGGPTFLDAVNAPAGFLIDAGPGYQETYYSFQYIDDWFKNEYERTTGRKDLSIQVEVFGPFPTVEKPPHRWSADDCGILKPFFEKHAREKGIDLGKYTVVNYVYFDEKAGYSEAFQYEGAAFWSCRMEGERITFIDTPPTFSLNGVMQAVRKVLHETAHVFGASDTYSAGGGCMDPEGLADPLASPKYPQKKTCLMCGCKPRSEHASACEIPVNITEIVLCDYTAIEFGWKTYAP